MILTTLRRTVLLSLVATAVGLTSASPISASEQDEPGEAPTADLPALGSGSPDTDEEIDASVDVNKLQQTEDGGYTSLTWTLRNNESNEITVDDFDNEVYTYGIQGKTEAAGVSLRDENGTRYYPLKDNSDTEVCLCSGAERSPAFHRAVSDGEQATYWAAFSLPEDLSTVTVDIPKFEPIEDVQIE